VGELGRASLASRRRSRRARKAAELSSNFVDGRRMQLAARSVSVVDDCRSIQNRRRRCRRMLPLQRPFAPQQ